MNTKLLLPMALLSTIAHGQEYQSISNLNYSNIDFDAGFKLEQINLDSRYYFDPRRTLGPLDQFSFINKTSNVYGRYIYSQLDNDDESGGDFNSNAFALGGEIFFSNFLIGGQYIRHESDDDELNINRLTMGYLINDDFLVKVDLIDGEDDERALVLSADYNYQINSTDYLGFSAAIDDDGNYQRYAFKYFKKLNGTQTLVTDVIVEDNDLSDHIVTGEMSFYFNNKTSLSASYNSEDRYSVGGKYFVNDNIGINASYNASSKNDSDSDSENIDSDQYMIGLSAQF